MKKRLTALVLALAALAWSVPAGAAALEGPGRVLLSWTGDARTTVTISWQDAAGVEAGYVTYAPEGRPEEEETVQAAATPYACGISNGGSRFEATLTGLTPGTGYTYRVGGPGGWSDWAAFTTDGAAEETVFLYMGDIQVNADAGAEFAAWGELAAGALRRSPDAAFGLLGGDIVESGVRTGEWDLFLDAAGPVFSRIPLMPANGNHESNFAGSGKPELYLDTFSLPLKGPAGFEEEFYSFDCGAVHVTVLNAWVVSGEQAVTEEDWAAIGGWLARDLAASTARWQVVVSHLPFYPVHSDTNADAARQRWGAILEDCGADLVLVGHQHVYARSYPLLQGRTDYENGIVYLMGNAGQKSYGSADESRCERGIYGVPTYQVLRAGEESLSAETFNGDGESLDFCAVSPRGSAMTRAGAAVLLHRLAGSPASEGAAPFTDVEEGAWYAGAAAWAAGQGIVTGTDRGTFAPNAPVTLEQFAAMLCRMDGGAAAGPDWNTAAMDWAAEAGLLAGAAGEEAGAPLDRTLAGELLKLLEQRGATQ